VTRAIADLALRRPLALLLAVLAVLAVLAGALAVATTAPDHVGVGSLRISGAGEGAEFSLVTRGAFAAEDRVYRVALDVITSQVRTDPAVEDVEQGPVSDNGRATSLAVTLDSADPGDVQQAAERIVASIDPGPLRVFLGGEPAVALDARHGLNRQLWKLELLALPFAVLVLWALVGLRVGLAAGISAAIAIAGTLAMFRLLAVVASVSLLGVAPAAVIGLVLGLELASLLAARFRDETRLAERAEAMRRALAQAAGLGALTVATVIAATLGLLATPLDQAGSIVLGCGLAAALAAVAAVVVTPAVLALGDRAEGAESAGDAEPRAAPAWRAPARWLARGPVRVGVASAAVMLLLLGLGVPGREGASRPLAAADLPAGAAARVSAELVEPSGPRADPQRDRDQSLFPKLPLAVAVSLAGLGFVLVWRFRSPRALLGAVPAFLPALAACGLAVAVFQDGHLVNTIGQRTQGALETGALACLLAALAAVGAARAAVATTVVHHERSLGLGVERTAEHAAALTMPAALVATLVGAAATGVLAGADLYPAREFGLAVAVGLLLDVLLIRTPLLAALARWG
jgi:uncharacterized membrane protein YdfJ with MMPL/SSD domain